MLSKSGSIVSKSCCPAKQNEDGIVARVEQKGRHALFAVLDGVSSIRSSFQGQGTFLDRHGIQVTPARWAMLQVWRALEEIPLSHIDAFQAVGAADARLGLAVQPLLRNGQERWQLPAVAGTVIHINEDRGILTWAQVADCMFIVERADGTCLVSKNPMWEIDTRMLQVFRETGYQHNNPRVQKILERQYRSRNGTCSYPVLDGAVNPDLVLRGCESVKNVRRIALWSDGLFSVSVPTETSLEVGRAILEGGLPAWFNHVQEREARDPSCLNPLRFGNDDKSGIVAERRP